MLKPLCVWKGFTAIQAAQATLKLRSNQHLEQKFTPLHRATSTRAQQQQLSGWLRSQITEQLLTFCIHLPPPPPSPFPLFCVVACNRQSIYCTSSISPCHFQQHGKKVLPREFSRPMCMLLNISVISGENVRSISISQLKKRHQ